MLDVIHQLSYHVCPCSAPKSSELVHDGCGKVSEVPVTGGPEAATEHAHCNNRHWRTSKVIFGLLITPLQSIWW
jgi:hypothetical protein